MITHADSDCKAVLVINATFDAAMVNRVSLLFSIDVDISLTLCSAKNHRKMMPFPVVKTCASVVTNCDRFSLQSGPDLSAAAELDFKPSPVSSQPCFTHYETRARIRFKPSGNSKVGLIAEFKLI